MQEALSQEGMHASSPVLHQSLKELKPVKFLVPTERGDLISDNITLAQIRDMNSFISVANNDKWSKKGVSSAISLTAAAEERGIANDIEYLETDGGAGGDKRRNCEWLRILCGNCFLPTIGIDSCRFSRKLYWKHTKSLELIDNTIYFCSRIYGFVRHDLIEGLEALAAQLYFPTGQIEADGLSVISAEIWAATYLLLGAHRKIREADFDNLRNTYVNLAWDSGHTHRATLEFQKSLQFFRSTITPIWSEIESFAGIPTSDFADIDTPHRSFYKKKKRSKLAEPEQLPVVRIHEDLTLRNTLNLHIISEKKGSPPTGEEREWQFNEMSHGKQLQIIQALLEKSLPVLQNASSVLRQKSETLNNDKLIAVTNKSGLDKDLTCTRTIKMLRATVKVLFREVKLPQGLRADIVRWLRFVSEEINSFISYAEWIVNKFSEFHSMLRLTYNFALLCFDLDLPSFQSVVLKEEKAETVHKIPDECGDRINYKTVSLTQLLDEANGFALPPGKLPEVDENFDWQDFYKTDYHRILEKLPLRLGSNLLQFQAQPDAKILLKPRHELALSSKRHGEGRLDTASGHRMMHLQ